MYKKPVWCDIVTKPMTWTMFLTGSKTSELVLYCFSLEKKNTYSEPYNNVYTYLTNRIEKQNKINETSFIWVYNTVVTNKIFCLASKWFDKSIALISTVVGSLFHNIDDVYSNLHHILNKITCGNSVCLFILSLFCLCTVLGLPWCGNTRFCLFI